MTTTTPGALRSPRRRLITQEARGWADTRPVRKGIAYARQSEDDSDGIDRQLEDCRRLAAQENVEIIREITENDQSASKSKPRPKYDGDLLPAIRAGEADVIIAQTQDRLLRKPKEMEELIDFVEAERLTSGRDIEILLYRSRIDLRDANGRAAARQGAVWARLEVEQKAERRVRAEQSRALQGRPPGGGRRAFGYTKGGTALVPEEAALVRHMFDRLLRGDSIHSIVRWLNDVGSTTPVGGPWIRSSVARVLRNARYAGIRTYYGEEVAEGDWPTIITREEHEAAVAVLDDPTRRTTPGNARRWIGTGLYLCGACIEMGEDGRNVLRVSSPSSRRKHTTRAYVCKAHHHMSRSVERVDAVVIAAVEALLARDDADLRLLHDVTDLAPLRTQADAIRAKIARAQRDYDDELIDAADLRQVKLRRQGELDVVERKIAHSVRNARLARLAHSTDPVAAFRKALEDGDLDTVQQVIDALLTVTLLKGTPGRVKGGGYFDPETVDIAPRPLD